MQGWRDYGPGSHTGPVGPNTLALLAHCPSGYLEVEVAAAPAPAAASAQPSTVQVRCVQVSRPALAWSFVCSGTGFALQVGAPARHQAA